MAFDYYAQPQGPTVPINLFGEAATAGINAGNALPTELTAGIQGAIKGYSQGLDFTAQAQQNEIRQHQIDREPVTDAIQDVELKRAPTRNELESLTLDTEAKTHEIAIENTKTKLQLENQAATQKLNDIKITKSIGQDLSSNDPNVRASVLTNPNYSDFLLRDENTAANVLSRLGNDKGLTEEQRNQALKLWDFSKQKQYELERERLNALAKKEALGGIPDAQKGLMKDPSIGQIMSTYNIPPTELGKRVQIFPYGLKTFNPDGTINTSKADNDISMGSVQPGHYQVVVDGKLAKSIAPLGMDSAKTLTGWQSLLYNAGITPREKEGSVSPTPSPSPTPNPEKPFLGSFVGAARDFLSEGPSNTPQVVGTPDPNATPNPNPTPPSATITVEGNNPVVNSKAQALLEKAKTDPDLMTRLQAKGYVRAPAPTPLQERNISMPTPKNVSEVVRVLPPSAKKLVEPTVVERVSANPSLQGLTPLQQAVVAVESGGNPTAKGKGSSAQGLFQLTNAAATDAKVDASTVEGNIQGGVRYLDSLLNRFGDNEVAALMAYNIGPSVISDVIELTNSTEYEDLVAGLKYLQSKGRYPKVLTDGNIKVAEAYPLKVLAYRDAFSQITYV